MRLSYAIKYVSDMDAAIAFHRDKLGLTLAFQHGSTLARFRDCEGAETTVSG